MSIKTAASLILGSLQYTSQAIAIDVRLQLLPGVNRCRATLPAGVKITAAPGDPGQIDLDGGDGSSAVLKGKVQSLRSGLLATDALIADAGAQLASVRQRATYEKQSASAIIRDLASLRSVDIGSLDIDLPLAAYVAHQSRSAAEHVGLLASLGQAIAFVDADGALSVVQRPGPQPEAALLYGREIVEYEVSQAGPQQAERIRIGNGPAGSADAPEALRPATGQLPGDASESGAAAIWQPQLALRTAAGAVTAGASFSDEAAANATRFRARCFLLPKLRPGAVIEIQSLPGSLDSGPWMLTSVSHHLHPRTAGVTILEGVKAGVKSGGESLRAKGLAAVGSLL